MQKDFDSWHKLKKKLEKNDKPVFFKERQIWWVSIGINIGNEQCGKGQRAVRPVLILKKFNNHFFFGVPLSSKQKDNRYYYNFEFKNKKQSAIIFQAKPISTKRLCDLYGYLSSNIFDEIRKETGELLNLS